MRAQCRLPGRFWRQETCLLEDLCSVHAERHGKLDDSYPNRVKVQEQLRNHIRNNHDNHHDLLSSCDTRASLVSYGVDNEQDAPLRIEPLDIFIDKNTHHALQNRT